MYAQNEQKEEQRTKQPNIPCPSSLSEAVGPGPVEVRTSFVVEVEGRSWRLEEGHSYFEEKKVSAIALLDCFSFLAILDKRDFPNNK